ncbi:MAG TPA: NUDIX domain-containing protein [Pseudonocardiaceae bacterium]|nr:NUDIX domain-containing protein [Pseudonocardiaceae bacterium]
MTGVENTAIRCVGAITRNSAGRLLLVRRGHDPHRGRWSIPGGRVEAGETDSDALRREMIEETALRVSVGARVGWVLRGGFEIHDYACTVESGQARAGDDAAELRWVSDAEFGEMDAADELVPRLAESLRDWGIVP